MVLFLTAIFASLTVGKLTDEWNPPDPKQDQYRWLERQYRDGKRSRLW